MYSNGFIQNLVTSRYKYDLKNNLSRADELVRINKNALFQTVFFGDFDYWEGPRLKCYSNFVIQVLL